MVAQVVLNKTRFLLWTKLNSLSFSKVRNFGREDRLSHIDRPTQLLVQPSPCRNALNNTFARIVEDEQVFGNTSKSMTAKIDITL